MERRPIESSNIRSAGFDKGVMQVEFNKGQIFNYFEVPYEVFNDFMNTKSKGSFFHVKIKTKFRYEKVDNDKT